MMSLVYFDELIARRRRARGPYSVGAAVAVEADAARVGILSPAQSLALMIATGIGLHNFSEGLAIGQSAASGEISLALMLVIGFGLHHATEGFGIVGPFATSDERPSWAFCCSSA
jgi:ZIP family zinc transporter